MSETVTADPPAAAEPPVDPVVADAPAPVDASPSDPPEPKKLSEAQKRFAQYTRRLTTVEAEKAALERDLAAAKALLEANKPPTDTPPALTDAEIDRRAEQRVREREFNAKISGIDATGRKEFGAEAWEAAKVTLTDLGATKNTVFLEALAETEHPQKIFAALADDIDALGDLLNKSPTGMAAYLGRMDAKMSETTKAAPVRTISAAPKPATPLQPGAVQNEVDPFGPDQDKLSMSEWNKAFEKSELGKRLLRRRA